MICNYGNQTQEILFPAKSLCSKEFGGELLGTMYTSSDYMLMFVGCMILFCIAFWGFGMVFFRVNIFTKGDLDE